MPSPTTYALFVLAALALLVIPGPAVLYVVAQSVGGGKRAGLSSVLGLHTGTLVHIAAAAAGISGLVVASATAFSVVKYVGAAYLIVMGLRRLATRERVVEVVPVVDHRRLYRDGIVVNVLNPKTARSSSSPSSRSSSTSTAASRSRSSRSASRSSGSGS